jgi:hypothetical protein
VNAVATITALRAAADSLAVDTAIWASRDPANLSREALVEARVNALRTVDATIGELGRLRRELAPGVHRVRGRHS